MDVLKREKPKRSYSGIKWKTNASNKRRLVEDFNHKCAYCDDTDIYGGGYSAYHVEHFAPKEKFKNLEFVYDNLLYSCPYCNIAKSDTWVGKTATENVVNDSGFIDPCCDEYYKHFIRQHDGSIKPLTPLGSYMYDHLKLYLKRHSIIYNLDRVQIQRQELKEKIKQKKEKGQECKALEDIYSKLCVVFCEYYDLFAADQ